MYLERRSFRWYNAPKTTVTDLPHIDNEKIREIVEQVGYWRKANHIHKWFVDNVQDGEDDCRSYYVTIEQLTALRDACSRVIADPSLAMEVLPPQAGFFFGGTEINDWYFDDLGHTVKIIDEILEHCEKHPDPSWGVSYHYCSSW